MRRKLSFLVASVCISLIRLLTADDSSATLHLVMTVPVQVSVSVDSTEAASNLNLTDELSDVLLGTVEESSNAVNGYTVQVTSYNAAEAGSSYAFLKNGTGQNIDYFIAYHGNLVLFTQGTAIVTSESGFSICNAYVRKEVRLMGISHVSTPQPGTYTDMLIFTISAN